MLSSTLKTKSQFSSTDNTALNKEINRLEQIKELLSHPAWQFIVDALDREKIRCQYKIETVSPLQNPTELIEAQSHLKLIKRFLGTPQEVLFLLNELLAEKEARVIKKDKENSLYLKIHNLQTK